MLFPNPFLTGSCDQRIFAYTKRNEKTENDHPFILEAAEEKNDDDRQRINMFRMCRDYATRNTEECYSLADAGVCTTRN